MTTTPSPATEASAREPWYRRRRTWFLALLLPAVAYHAALFVYPLVRILSRSVFDPSFTLEHFADFFHSEAYVSVMLTTFEVGFWVTLLALLLGYPVAYLMANSRPAVASILVVVVLLPFLTSILVRSFAWMVVLGRHGLVNEWLVDLGLVDAPLPLMYNRLGVYIGLVQVMLPMMILPLYSTMLAIDRRFSRAAANLGAGPVRQFLSVYLPLSLPGVVAGSLLVFIQTLGFFITPALLGGRRDVMIAQLIELQINQLLNWGFAAAIALVLLAATIGLFVVYTRLLGVDRLWSGAAGGTTRPPRPGRRIRSPSAPRMRDRIRDCWADVVERLPLPSRFALAPGVDPTALIARLLAGRAWLVVIVTLVGCYLMLPNVVVVIASFSDSETLDFPPRGFSLHLYRNVLESDVWMEVTLRSFRVGAAVACVAVVIGTLAAFPLVRARFPGSQLLTALLVSPMILPIIVTSLAIYYFFSELGLVGSEPGLVLGHGLLAIPFVIIIVSATLRTFDRSLESASQSLGASPLRTFFWVTLPIIRPGLITAATFAFLVSFDELIITMFISGVRSATLPKQMWDSVHDQVDATLAAVSTILILVTTALMLGQGLVRRGAKRRRRAVPVSTRGP